LASDCVTSGTGGILGAHPASVAESL